MRNAWQGLALALMLLLAARLPAEPAGELERQLAGAAGAERLKLLAQLAESHRFTSTATSQRYAEEALTLARALQDRKGEAAALRDIGIARDVAGDHRQALVFARQALALYQSLGEQKAAAAVLNNIGIAHRMMGEHNQALEAYRRSLSIEEALGNDKGLARSLTNLGNVYYDRKDYAQALAHQQRALATYRRLGDASSIATALNNLAIILIDLRDNEQALAHLLEATRLLEQAGDAGGAAACLVNIGDIHLDLRQAAEARPAFEKALDLATRSGDRNGIATAEIGLGNVDLAGDAPDAALAHFQKAAALARDTGHTGALAAALDSVGLAQRERGRPAEALAAHREALALREAASDEHGVAKSLGNLGRAEIELGHWREAEGALRRGLELAKATRTSTLQDILENLALLYRRQGRYEQALAFHEQYVAEKERHLNALSVQAVAGLRARYDAERRERENADLAARNTLLSREREIERLKTRALILLLALLAVGLAFLFRRYRHLLAFWKRQSYVGPYRLLEPLGAGGMGEVFKATHVRDTTRQVAVKVLRQQYTQDPILRQRFKNEAVLIDQLDHPHIVKVFERGEHDRRLYIAMELVKGRSLAELIRAGERLPLNDCVGVMGQLADTLAQVHAQGIVHRDLKPENIMLVDAAETQPFVKLLDFDIAKSHSLTRLTESGEILGTVGYLAPEQITRQCSSPASDVYALGIVFYELLTLERPFLGEMPMDVVRQILERQPLPPATLRPEVPADVSVLIMEMLAKDPAGRPDDSALAQRLAELEPRAS